MSSNLYASEYHAPIMVEEVLHWLNVMPGGLYVDGTAGGGGHSAAILDRSAPDGRLIAIDRDPEALSAVRERLAEEAGSRLTLVNANYAQAAEILAERGALADGWLVDAGVSSHQLDEPSRGFSFQQPGPLDMRMGPDVPTLAEYLETTSREELARVIKVYGEVRGSWGVAGAILGAFSRGELKTTTDLADVVASKQRGGSRKIHPATLVFQALRIAVNRELEHLEAAVRQIPDVVKPGGRAVFVSFHSLEDRIVKHTFRELADPCTCPRDFPRCACGKEPLVEVLTRQSVVAGDEEVQTNPRARSARLRAIEVLPHPRSDV
ncbi:16S rRNA (cytosine(1402)-N(4))-methyltransferase RsmH [Lujinxingia vulgaris]|nr:16S rRNA (cytosine(1402)-N(4))-methyltransferase RsmH [Lujinxingia vulgaris]